MTATESQLVRILITGSREWQDRHAVADALTWAIGEFPHLIVPGGHGPVCRWGLVTVVHGAARGADTIAARIAAVWGMRVESYPAEWDQFGRSAGHRRNAEMVALGADLCLAFPLGESRGTRGCMALCVKAGIRVVDWPAEGATLMAAAGLRVTS